MKIIYNILLVLLISISGLAQTVQIDGNFTNPKEEGKLKYGLSNYSLAYQNKTSGIEDSTFNQLYQTQKSFIFIENDSLLVDLIAESDILSMNQEIKKSGLKILASAGFMTTCKIHFNQLPIINKIVSCRWAQPVWQPSLNSGNVQTQGDLAQRSDIARAISGLNGNGVKVGVISDSYNNKGGANISITNYELPGSQYNPSGNFTPVTVLLDYPSNGAGYPRSDEGRAMLEIIHDIAPKAQLYFSTGSLGIPVMVNSIRQLANAGCKVIVDDISYYGSPFFQDGALSQIVDSVVNNMGVIYLTSAGNNKNLSYENQFVSSQAVINSNEIVHNFGTINGQETHLVPFTVLKDANGNGEIKLSLQWNQPFKSISPNGATTDLNMYIGSMINNQFQVIASSTSNNVGSDPYEFISVGLSNMSSNITLYILLSKKSGSNPSKLKIIYNSGEINFISGNLNGFQSATCFGQSNSEGAIVVGSTNFSHTPAFGVNSPLISNYSSIGGVPILFNSGGSSITPIIRNKPDLVGPDGANTSFFGQNNTGIDTDSYPNFYGTSASAPHIAAVATLMKQAKPNATPSEIKSKLIASCTDMDDPYQTGFQSGFDFASGNGFVNADVAVLGMYSITASNPTNSFICQGANLRIDFTASGVFQPGNQYKLELSDASGSFSNPLILGTKSSISSSTFISAPIPYSVSAGTNYKVRITSTNPNSVISNLIAISVIGSPNPPVLTISENNVCSGTQITLTASGCSNGVINWNGSVGTGSSLSFSASSSLSFFSQCTVNGCKSDVSNTLNLIVKPPVSSPNIEISTNTICSGDSALLTASNCTGAVSWFKDLNTMVGAGNTFYAKTNALIYSAKCTVNGCTSGHSNYLSLGVTSLPAPPIITINKTSICIGDSALLSSSNCSGTVSWFNNFNATVGNGHSIYVKPGINTTNSYTAICIVNGCSSVHSSNPLSLAVKPLPTATLSGSQSIISGANASLSASLTGTAPFSIVVNGTTYPNINSSPFQFNVSPSSTTTYTLSSVSDNFCTSAVSINNTATVTVSNQTISTATIAGSTFCPGSALSVSYTANGTFTSGNIFTGQLSNSSGSFANGTSTIGTFTGTSLSGSIPCTIPANAIAGTAYRIRVISSNPGINGADNGSNLEIGFIPSVPSLTSSASSVCVGSTATVSATGCSGTVNWSTGATGALIDVNTSAAATLNYTATCTVNGCISGTSNSASVTVTNSPTAPEISASANSVCVGGTATVSATGCTGTVTWSTGATGASINVNTSAIGTLNYTATCTLNGCISGASNSVSVVVSGIPTPPVLTSSATSVCVGGSATVTASGCAGTVLWSTGENGNSINVNTSTSGTLNFTATCNIGNNCVSGNSNTISVIIGSSFTASIQAPSSPNPPTSYCQGSTAPLFAVPNGPGYTFQWKKDGVILSQPTDRVFPVSSPGVYSVIITQGNCSSLSNEVTVTEKPTPSAPNISSDKTEICFGQSVNFTASGCTGIVTWSFSNTPGNTFVFTPSPIPGQTGFSGYDIKAQCNLNSCFSNFSNTISVNASPIPTVTVSPTGPIVIPVNGSETLNATVTFADTYQWYRNNSPLNNQTTTSLIISQEGNYKLLATNSLNQCSAESNVVNASINSACEPYGLPHLMSNTNAICPGENAVLTVLNSPLGFDYQWKLDNVNVAGNNKPLFIASQAGVYSVDISPNWYQVGPIPNEENLNSMTFINSKIGFAVGYRGTLLKTEDEGSSWFPVFTGLNESFYKIYFQNSDEGWITANSGKVFKTSNSGQSWLPVDVTSNSYEWNSIDFYQKNFGVLVGYNGRIRVTSDGGLTWSVNNYQNQVNLKEVKIINPNLILAIGNGGKLLKSTDMGINWIESGLNTTSDLNQIHFRNNLEGWIVGKNGLLLKSTDGGTTWNPISTSFNFDNYSIGFVSPNKIFMTCSQNKILISNDYGITWQLQDTYSDGTPNSGHTTNLFINPTNSKIFRFGSWGTIISSIDLGQTWQIASKGTSTGLKDVEFLDQSSVIAVGPNSNIMKSLDKGKTWSKINPVGIPSGSFLYSLKFTSSNIGFVIDNNAGIYKTTDAGLTWTTQRVANTNEFAYDICFINATKGFVIGGNGLLIETNDGGSTWQSRNIGYSSAWFQSIKFIDENIGWITGDQGIILKTIDGGNTWNPQTSGVIDNISKTFFINQNSGWAITNSFGATNKILKTVNGGNTWQIIYTTSNQINDIIFKDSNLGSFVGSFGVISETLDGGLSWLNKNKKLTFVSQNSLAKNADNIFISVGESSTIYRLNTLLCPSNTNSIFIESLNTTVPNTLSGNSGQLLYEYKNSQQITSSQTIIESSNIKYKASQSITLTPGFKTSNEVLFTAEIKTCNN